MGGQPSTEEQQRRLEAVDNIYQQILAEARTRDRAYMRTALHEVYNQISDRVLRLMDTIRRSEREAAEAAGKEVKP